MKEKKVMLLHCSCGHRIYFYMQTHTKVGRGLGMGSSLEEERGEKG